MRKSKRLSSIFFSFNSVFIFIITATFQLVIKIIVWTYFNNLLDTLYVMVYYIMLQTYSRRVESSHSIQWLILYCRTPYYFRQNNNKQFLTCIHWRIIFTSMSKHFYDTIEVLSKSTMKSFLSLVHFYYIILIILFLSTQYFTS